MTVNRPSSSLMVTGLMVTGLMVTGRASTTRRRQGWAMVAVFACLTPLMMAAPIHGSAGRECHSESEKYPSESSQAVEEIGVTERCTRRVSVEAPIGTITPVASVTDEHARLIAVCFTASQYAHHNGHGGPLLI